MKLKYFLILIVPFLITCYKVVGQTSSIKNLSTFKQNGKIAAIYNVDSKLYAGSPETIARQYLSEQSRELSLKNNLND